MAGGGVDLGVDAGAGAEIEDAAFWGKQAEGQPLKSLPRSLVPRSRQNILMVSLAREHGPGSLIVL
jgi:hypothetical protein